MARSQARRDPTSRPSAYLRGARTRDEDSFSGRAQIVDDLLDVRLHRRRGQEPPFQLLPALEFRAHPWPQALQPLLAVAEQPWQVAANPSQRLVAGQPAEAHHESAIGGDPQEVFGQLRRAHHQSNTRPAIRHHPQGIVEDLLGADQALEAFLQRCPGASDRWRALPGTGPASSPTRRGEDPRASAPPPPRCVCASCYDSRRAIAAALRAGRPAGSASAA